MVRTCHRDARAHASVIRIHCSPAPDLAFLSSPETKHTIPLGVGVRCRRCPAVPGGFWLTFLNTTHFVDFVIQAQSQSRWARPGACAYASSTDVRGYAYEYARTCCGVCGSAYVGVWLRCTLQKEPAVALCWWQCEVIMVMGNGKSKRLTLCITAVAVSITARAPRVSISEVCS